MQPTLQNILIITDHLAGTYSLKLKWGELRETDLMGGTKVSPKSNSPELLKEEGKAKGISMENST